MFIIGIIPKAWSRYTVPSGLTVLQWIVDFSERTKQLQRISMEVSKNGSHVLKVYIIIIIHCIFYIN